jgi:hypothetical protein
MNIEDLMGGEDLKKFRVVTGYGFCPANKQFKARPHHTVFYAKDQKVLNFMVVMARVPKGQLVQELAGDFPVCEN